MYLLSLIPEKYKGLDIPENESYLDYDCLRWAGRSKIESWKKPRLAWFEDEFSSHTAPVADFTAFGGGPIALSSKAYLVLKKLFSNQAEFLPTIGPESDDEWRLLNVINVLDIMDTSKSKYEIYSSGKVGKCSHAFLNEPSQENKIFQVSGYFPFVFIDGEVKQAIESAGLTGALIREYLNP